MKFGAADRVINLIGPDHHGYVGRMRAAMQALGHPAEALDVLIVQLVTLLRDGQPVRMSKRRGEFVLMEELLEEVGRDAARFTFLTRRHDSPLDFDLAVAARQTADNPVYYVQYAHARIRSIGRQVAEQGIAVPPWGEVDTSVAGLPEEQQLIKRLLQFPELVAGAARALEPHRVAYWLQELAGLFHPYYRAHRVIQDDRALMPAPPGPVHGGGAGARERAGAARRERAGDHVTWRIARRHHGDGCGSGRSRRRRMPGRPRRDLRRGLLRGGTGPGRPPPWPSRTAATAARRAAGTPGASAAAAPALRSTRS